MWYYQNWSPLVVSTKGDQFWYIHSVVDNASTTNHSTTFPTPQSDEIKVKFYNAYYDKCLSLSKNNSSWYINLILLLIDINLYLLVFYIVYQNWKFF